MPSRQQSGQNLARKADFRPGSNIAQHRVIVMGRGGAGRSPLLLLCQVLGPVGPIFGPTGPNLCIVIVMGIGPARAVPLSLL